MSGLQQQTEKTVTDMAEADAIISQLAKLARNAQAVLGRADADSRKALHLSCRLAEFFNMDSLYFTSRLKQEPSNCCFY